MRNEREIFIYEFSNNFVNVAYFKYIQYRTILFFIFNFEDFSYLTIIYHTFLNFNKIIYLLNSIVLLIVLYMVVFLIQITIEL